jgi:hypothetical protein
VRLQPGRRAARPARVEDKLVTTQFWNTTSRGFSAREEPSVAVCLLPGTEVAFENKVERQLTGFQLLFRRTKRPPHKVARFRQVNMDNPCAHHDALEFPDGQIVWLRIFGTANARLCCNFRPSRKMRTQRLIRLSRKRDLSLTGSAIRRRVERCNGETIDAGSGRGRRYGWSAVPIKCEGFGVAEPRRRLADRGVMSAPQCRHFG